MSNNPWIEAATALMEPEKPDLPVKGPDMWTAFAKKEVLGPINIEESFGKKDINNVPGWASDIPLVGAAFPINEAISVRQAMERLADPKKYEEIKRDAIDTRKKVEEFRDWVGGKKTTGLKSNFDPEGDGYDTETASPLIKKYPLTISKPTSYKGDYVTEDGAFESWVWHPDINDYVKHQASRNPETGQILKGKKHKTYNLTIKGESDAGYEIYKGEDGRYYSRLKNDTGNIVITPKMVSDDGLKQNRLKEEDIQTVERFIQNAVEMDVRGTTFGAKATEGIAKTVQFMAEFAVTGGIYGSLSSGSKAGLTMLVEKYAPQAAGKLLVKGGVRLSGAMAGTVGRTAALGGNVVSDYEQSMAAQATGLQNEQSAMETAKDSVGGQYIQNLTEVGGEGLGWLLNRSRMGRRLMASGGKVTAAITGGERGKVLRDLFKKTGYHGMPGEFMEERMSTSLSAITGVEDYGTGDGSTMAQRLKEGFKQDIQNLPVELVVLATPMTAQSVLGGSVSLSGKAYERLTGKIQKLPIIQRYEFKKNVLTPEGAGMFTAAFPEKATILSVLTNPSRSDFEAVGITGWSGKERQALVDLLKQVKPEDVSAKTAEVENDIGDAIETVKENQDQIKTDLIDKANTVIDQTESEVNNGTEQEKGRLPEIIAEENPPQAKAVNTVGETVRPVTSAEVPTAGTLGAATPQAAPVVNQNSSPSSNSGEDTVLPPQNVSAIMEPMTGDQASRSKDIAPQDNAGGKGEINKPLSGKIITDQPAQALPVADKTTQKEAIGNTYKAEIESARKFSEDYQNAPEGDYKAGLGAWLGWTRSVRSILQDVAGKLGLDYGYDSAGTGSEYLTFHKDGADFDFDMSVRLSDHKQKYGGTDGSIEINDFEKSLSDFIDSMKSKHSEFLTQNSESSFNPSATGKGGEITTNKSTGLKSNQNLFEPETETDQERVGLQGYQQINKSMDEVPNTKPIGSSEIVKSAEDLFGIPIREGWVKRAAGTFNRLKEVIRQKGSWYGDVYVLAHEIGHHISNVTKLLRNAPNSALNEIRKLDYQPGRQDKEEGFAEWFASYITDEGAEKIAPQFARYFESVLQKNPEMAQKVSKLKEMVGRFRDQGAKNRGLKQLSFNGKEAKSEGKTTGKMMMDVFNTAMRHFYTAMKDEGHWLSQFTKEARAKGAIAPGESPYEIFLAFSQGGPTQAANAIQNGVFKMTGNMEKIGPSMHDILHEIKPEEYEDFSLFCYARHAIEAWSKGHNPGIARDDAQHNYDQLKNDRFERGAAKLTEFNNALLDMLTDAGVLDSKSAQKMKNAWQTYVPLQRVKPGLLSRMMNSGGKKLVGVSDPVQGRKKGGSGLTVMDPIQATVERTVRFYERAAQQIVISKMVEIARTTKGMGKWMERLQPKTQTTAFSINEIADQLKELGVDTDTALNGIDPMERLFLFKPSYQTKNSEPVARVIINGKPQLYYFDKDLFKSINGMNYFTMPVFLEMTVGKVTRAVKMGATGINMAFTQRNLIKDYLTYLAQTKEGAKPVSPVTMIGSYVWSEVQHVLGNEKDPIVQLWQQMGGELSQTLGLDRKKIRATIDDVIADSTKRRAYNIAKNPIEALRSIIGITEVGPRLTEFKAVLDRHGYTRESLEALLRSGQRPPRAVLVEAINAANDVTTNFKRMGYIGKWLNRMIPYFNAVWEGNDKFIRTLRDNPKRAAIALLSFAAVRTMYWFAVKDDDWYKEAPSWLKYGFYTITDDGKPIIRIPINHAWGITVAGGVESILNRMYQDDPNSINDYFKQMAKEFGIPSKFSDTMSYAPAGIKQILEAWANKDTFRDSKIVPDSLANLKPEDQATAYNSNTAKWMGKELGISPAQIEHFLDGVTGGMFGKASGLAERGDVKKLAVGLSIDRESMRSVDEFYQQKESVLQEYNSAKKSGEVARELNIKHHTLEDYASLISDLRKSIDGVSDRDKRFEVEKYIAGLSRKAIGKEELDRYPDPLKSKDLPESVKSTVETFIGRKLYALTDPKPERRKGEKLSDFKERLSDYSLSVERSKVLLDNIDEKTAVKLIQTEARRRGLKSVTTKDGEITPFGHRISILKRQL